MSSYDDLTKLQTFGFRGEALSSLCAVSKFHVVTARDGEAPKGTRLDFETSGRLAGRSVAACTKGTTISVEELFHRLPVRRRELEKNIKREYGKALGLLHAYACICTNVRLSVSNQMKGKKVAVFSTRGNSSTRENISNIYGAKTLPALLPLELSLDLQPTAPGQALAERHIQHHTSQRRVNVVGHISKPVFGEGRQAPDRQMFFVNSRPCALPQLSKAFNEVYKTFNLTQSPFIFANLLMDTNAYDVNVSPDKRTIMLHEQHLLIESLKEQLNALFETSDQTVPMSHLSTKRLASSRPLSVAAKGISAEEDTTTFQRPSQQQLASGAAALSDTEVMTSHARRSDANMWRREAPEVNAFLSAKEQDRDTPRADASVAAPLSREGPSSQGPDAPTSTSTSSSSSARHDPKQLTGQCRGRSLQQQREAPPAGDEYRAADRKAQLSRRVADHHAQELKEREPEPEEQTQDAEDESDNDRRQRPVSRPFHDFAARAVSLPEQDKPAGHKSTETEYPRTDAAGKVGEEAEATSMEAKQPRRSAFDAIQSPAAKFRTSTVASAGAPALYSPANKTPRMKVYSASQVPPSTQSVSLARFAAPGPQHAAPMVAQRDLEEVRSSGLSGDESQDDEMQDLLCPSEDQDSESASSKSPDVRDGDYVDEQGHRIAEEARVQAMVEQAEAAAALPTQETKRRAANMLRSSSYKPRESVLHLVGSVQVDVERIAADAARLQHAVQWYVEAPRTAKTQPDEVPASSKRSEEERLSLIITKTDFPKMRVVGQFNLGFILALRDGCANGQERTSNDLFIIDQHASDEIYNFSRLYLTTALTPQPLVHPRTLDLTAVEEEIVFAHKDTTLRKNGFNVVVDSSGESPVGKRCKLLTLPTSKDTVFDFDDLNELLGKLIEAPTMAASSSAAGGEESSPPDEAPSTFDLQRLSESGIIRPDKVRRMLAMRACRSSIMVGRPLSQSGMKKVLRHMGEIQRPWNCPHGRPTMRHLCGLDEWESWSEGDGLADEKLSDAPSLRAGERGAWDLGGGRVDWTGWVRSARERHHDQGDSGDDGFGASGQVSMEDA